MPVNDEDFKEFEKKYFLLKKTSVAQFIGTIIVTIAVSSGITQWFVNKITAKGSTAITTSDGKSELKYYPKTFIFWVPLFKKQEAFKEAAFNNKVRGWWEGFTRWSVNGQYGNDTTLEPGWFYQISMSKEHSGVEIDDIATKLANEFPNEKKWYVTEVRHNNN